MNLPKARMFLILTILSACFSSCGGGGGGLSIAGGGGGNGGGGGGGGNSDVSISQLAPSFITVGIPTGEVTIYGAGFTSQSVVLMDGQSIGCNFVNSTTLTAQAGTSAGATAGTHQFVVQDATGTSNALTLTVYVPQQGPNVMQAMPGYLVGEFEVNPSFVVAADVNGDGFADVVISGPPLSTGPSIAILDGQSDGNLAPAQYVSVPSGIESALAVGDINGDGNLDLVYIASNGSLSSSSATVYGLLGDGHGNFQLPEALQSFTLDFPQYAELVDLDGDGKLDLVLSGEQSATGSTSLIWLKNTGGSFSAPTTLLQQYTLGFAVGDINGDGIPDIVYATADASQAIHILFNQGSGQFKDEAAGGLNGVNGVPTILDFNGDGIADLVLMQATNEQLYSFAGNGAGTYTQIAVVTSPPIVQLVVGDFDHDGSLDLAGPSGIGLATGLQYFFNDGHGNFTPQIVVGPDGQYAAAGDFNGDGIADVVVPDEFAVVALALGRTDRNQPSLVPLTPQAIGGLSTGAITPGGLSNIFMGGDPLFEIPGNLFLNQGGESFALGAQTDPTTFMVADLTGKGVVDLLGGTLPNLEIWPNNGTPSFSSSPITVANAMSLPIVADMNGDGFPDLVTSGQIYYGNGAYQFTPVALPSTFSGPYVVGDFNGDHQLDVLNATYTYFNIGNRMFQLATSNTNLPLIPGGTGVAVADFNGDGKDDLAVNLGGEDWISIYYSRGDGTFYLGTQLDVGQEASAFVAGDFNGDGKIDLAVGLLTAHQVCMLFNNGQGQFTRSYFAAGALTVQMTTADLIGNGKPDLVIANFPRDNGPSDVNIAFHQ